MPQKKTQRRKTKSKKTKTTNRDILEEIIRVDHAGEYGATRIYDGQIAIFGKNSKIGKTIQYMSDQEQEHIEKFKHFLDYATTHTDALITYCASNMVFARHLECRWMVNPRTVEGSA